VPCLLEGLVIHVWCAPSFNSEGSKHDMPFQ
jgi:hypothetical protein